MQQLNLEICLKQCYLVEVQNGTCLFWKKQGFYIIFAGSLESAYSLIRGSHEIWGESLGTFMISRPIYQCSDWRKFLELFISDIILQRHKTAMWTTSKTSFL